MSDFRKIDCLGWWEDELGRRFQVLHIAYGCAFTVCMKRDQIAPHGVVIEETAPCRHLPDCTGWDWVEPEPVKEIEFPDEINQSIDWVVLSEHGRVGLCKNEPKHAQYGGWSDISCWVPSQVTLRGIPSLDDVGGDWKKAKWKRKAKTDDGWIDWNGGECPVGDDVSVRVRFRNGKESYTTIPFVFYWQHFTEPYDIMAYRIVGAK